MTKICYVSRLTCGREWHILCRQTSVTWEETQPYKSGHPSMYRNEPCHEIMVLFVLRQLSLQTRLHSHPVGLDVWFLIRPFDYFHTSCIQTAKALARLPWCAGSPEPSLVTHVISTIISWAGSNDLEYGDYRSCQTQTYNFLFVVSEF